MTPIDRVIEVLSSARRITAMTGAGVSAASGIPTFRGADGLWKQFRAETLATADAFERDPALVWEWYDWRRQLIRDAQPNDAHRVLAEWTRTRPDFTLLTQNVDGLHERAGAERLVRLHGSIWHVRCWDACDRGAADWLDDRAPLPELPPRCPHCNGLVRPGVVWFGEALRHEDVSLAAAATDCDVFLTIGTSSIVYPAAGLVHRARAHGAVTIEINPQATDATSVVDIVLPGKAEEILPRLAGPEGPAYICRP